LRLDGRPGHRIRTMVLATTGCVWVGRSTSSARLKQPQSGFG
jgi:hypothetical protein